MDADPIDRKDTLGPMRPNDLGDIYHKPSKSPQVPLISSSYASTKLQGMGVSKQEPTSTTSSPSYYSQWPIKSTTEGVLDFWPPAKPSTEAAPEYYDYEEVSAEVSETHPPSPSPSPPATTLPPFEFEETETPRPIPPKKKQDVKKPELPLPPPTPEVEVQPPLVDFKTPDIDFRPPELPVRTPEHEVKVPELEMRPPLVDFRPHELPARPQGEFRPHDLPQRPPQGEFHSHDLPQRPPQGEFRPHDLPVRPLETEMRPPEVPYRPPQGVPLPPRYEPERPQLDTQGWKQAQTPPPSPGVSSTRVQFPEDNPTTPVPFRQPLPQGYEPRPPPHFRLPQRGPPLRRPPPDSPYAFVEAKPIDRVHYESRPPPPPPPFRYRPYQKVNGVRNRNDELPTGNLPNILPQFRPNASPDPDKFLGFRQAPPPPPPMKRLQPPSGPLVGRRVGSEVSTLQMMKGAVSRPPARDDAPIPQFSPPPPLLDNRPVAPAERADGPGVFVVYANSKANDVHVGVTRGPHKPLPPNRLQERPILPGKSNFPYALEKPLDATNLQDPPPPQAKNPSVAFAGATPTVSTVVRPHSAGSEFTVSAVMHAGPGGGGHQGQVFVVAPQHRPEPSKLSNDVITGSHHPQHHHHNQKEAGTPPPEPFLAPFHASANVAPSPGNGWTALREGEVQVRPHQGVVERADIDMPEPSHEQGSKFDIENFSPQLIGGFQPIMPDEAAPAPKASEPEKKVELQTADRQERLLF